MEHRLARAEGDHEVGVDDRRMDAVDAAVDLQRAEILRLAVVHDDLPTEAACPIRAEELLELATTRTAAEPSGHEDGHALARDAVPLELVEHRGQRIAPRVVLGRGKRQRRRLEDDRRPAPAGRKCLERLAGERVAERLGDRRSHVRERVERGWRGEQERVVGEGHERDPRAGVQGDARHAVIFAHTCAGARLLSGDRAKQAVEMLVGEGDDGRAAGHRGEGSRL